MSKRRHGAENPVIDLTSEAEDEPPRKRHARPERTAIQQENASSGPVPERSDSSSELESDTPPTSISDNGDIAPKVKGTARKQHDVKRRELSHVATTGPAYPRSAYQGWEPPIEPVSELDAIRFLSTAHEDAHQAQRPAYTYFELNAFSIYKPRSATAAKDSHSGELVTLDRVSNHRGHASLLLEGVLSCGTEKRYVQGIPFSTLTLDGYGDLDVCDMRDNGMRDKVCIQSDRAAGTNIWYRLGTPSSEYQRFYTPFLWLAEFAKHFADYLLEAEAGSVTLEHFRSRFFDWLLQRYDSSTIRMWLAEGKHQDFRTTVVANVGFLLKECYGIDDSESGLCKHPIWGEVNRDHLTAIPSQPNKERWTVVTPFVHDCFKHMYFASHLRVRPILDPEISKQVSKRKLELKLTPLGVVDTHQTPQNLHASEIRPTLQEGDVVCVTPDKGSRWRNPAAVWYAYVQAVRTTVLDVLWLYESGDTTLGAAFYPFRNELFLSDNCNCGDDAIDLDRVLYKVDIAWGVQNPAAAPGFFVRQKFRTVHEEDTYDFVELKDSDFRCRCTTPQSSAFDECTVAYNVNDTVLVLSSDGDSDAQQLEPAQIIHFDHSKRLVQLRRLRRATDVKGVRPNELALTKDLFDLAPEHIVRKCQVHFFAAEDVRKGVIPTPYDRDGACDYYFCTRDVDARPEDGDEDTLDLPTEGWDPRAETVHAKELTGMGIFCGGGNFDRGLEEGGAVKFKYAVDWAERALHTYRANAEDPHAMEFFLGSVNDYLAQAIAGSTDARIARPGAVAVLAAGSPCPGFSALQLFKQSEQSLANASMVASVVSFVDFYSPEYCFLENVVNMTHGMGASKDENVFAQILAALVAMGYQVQQFLIDAWSVGSPQSRSRVFIVASAPGHPPLRLPPHTHAHPRDTRFMQKSLGRSSNGLPFGLRRDDYTPFPHVSAAQAVADLPDIGDAQVQLCPSFPDHRTPAEASSAVRTRSALVPILPPGMGIVQAHKAGLITGGEPLRYVESLGPVRANSKSTTLARIYPKSLFPTITTVLRTHDGIAGRCMHWQQHRSITAMEVRRAQGFPDNEVIIGSPAEQVVIGGNSVDRKVSLALGLSLRDSWQQRRIRVVDPPVRDNATPNVEDRVVEMLARTTITPDPIGPDASGGFGLDNTRYDSTPESERKSARQDWVQQSRAGTLRLSLSDAEVKEIREGGGFRTIKRILDSREGKEAPAERAS